MAGHSTMHPFLKTYDELKRSINRMETYLKVFGKDMKAEEQEAVQTVIEDLTHALNHIPEEYRVSRWKQYNQDK